jgi:xylose isomerase
VSPSYRDIAPEGSSWQETNDNLEEIVAVAAELQEQTGIRPLWGAAQLSEHPRYRDGAATASDPLVFAFAAAQTKKAMDVRH